MVQPGLFEHPVDVFVVELLAQKQTQILSRYQARVRSVELIERRLCENEERRVNTSLIYVWWYITLVAYTNTTAGIL